MKPKFLTLHTILLATLPLVSVAAHAGSTVTIKNHSQHVMEKTSGPWGFLIRFNQETQSHTKSHMASSSSMTSSKQPMNEGMVKEDVSSLRESIRSSLARIMYLPTKAVPTTPEMVFIAGIT